MNLQSIAKQLEYEIVSVLRQKQRQVEQGKLNPEILGFIKGLEFVLALIELYRINELDKKEENHEKNSCPG